MTELLRQILDPVEMQSIETMHRIQKNLYGVCVPPTLKQLMGVRQLLISTGNMHKVHAEHMQGLSKVECKMLLKKLNSIYKYGRRDGAGKGVG